MTEEGATEGEGRVEGVTEVAAMVVQMAGVDWGVAERAEEGKVAAELGGVREEAVWEGAVNGEELMGAAARVGVKAEEA